MASLKLNTSSGGSVTLSPTDTASNFTVSLPSANATLVTTAAIGVSVQAYDADALSASDIGVSVQAYDADALSASDIGVSVQAYDADIPTVAASQVEMETGSEPALRTMSPLRVKQAITSLAPTPSALLTPTNVSPSTGTTGVGATPTLTGSTYYSLYGITMSAAQWQVSTVSNFASTVVNTGDVAGTSVSYNVSSGVLSVSTTYYWRVRYKDANGVYSEWSTGTSFTTAVSFGPTVIGESYGGGYYAGKINDGGTQYYLIVAPKASGENSSKQWKTTNSTTAGTTSVIAGPTNSANMNNASHPAAQFCEALTIGGYTDWYMPAKNELEVCYYFLKPDTTANNASYGANANAVSPEPISTNYSAGSPTQTTATIFRTGSTEPFAAANYWSSTENVATNAWSQNFDVGRQNNNTKDGSFYVRAVRRLPV